jgi:hypothetical protein
MKVNLLFIITLLFAYNLTFAQHTSLLLPYEKKCKYGLISEAGKVILKPKFDYIDFLGVIFKTQKIEKSKSFYGAISKQGKVILPCKFDDLYVMDGSFCINDDTPKENFIVATSKNAKKYFTLKGIEFHLKESPWQLGDACGATDYHQFYDTFSFNNKYGIVSYNYVFQNYDTLVRPIYDNIEIASICLDPPNLKCFFIVTKNGRSGILNDKGVIITPIEYDNIGFTRYSGINLFVGSKNKLSTIIDTLGSEIFPTYYNSIEALLVNKKYFFIVLKDSLNAVIDYYSNVFIPFTTNTIVNNPALSGFLITDKKTSKIGLHSYNKLTIPCKYNKISGVVNDRFALVQRENTCKFYYDMKLKKEIRF